MRVKLKPETERISQRLGRIPLSDGDVADVIEILIGVSGRSEYRIVDPDGGSFLASVADFIIVSAVTPSGWAILPQLSGGLQVTFPEFAEVGFWERYFDGDPAAVQMHDDVLAHALSED